MSDSAVEIKGAAARLAAAIPSGGKRLTMEFGPVFFPQGTNQYSA